MDERKSLLSEFIAQLDKEGRETIIRHLSMLIEKELENPDDAISEDLIGAYSDMIGALLPDDNNLSEEEIEKRLAEIKRKAKEMP